MIKRKRNQLTIQLSEKSENKFQCLISRKMEGPRLDLGTIRRKVGLYDTVAALVRDYLACSRSRQ